MFAATIMKQAILSKIPEELHIEFAEYATHPEIVSEYGFEDEAVKAQVLRCASEKMLKSFWIPFLYKHQNCKTLQAQVSLRKCSLYNETQGYDRTGKYSIYVVVPERKAILGRVDRFDAMKQVLDALPEGRLDI